MAEKTRCDGEWQLIFKEYLDYDKETGDVKWIKSNNPRVVVGSKAGSKNSSGYLIVGVANRYFLLHRVIYLMETGSWPPGEIDHINRVRTDNSWKNLRSVTPDENRLNKKPHRNRPIKHIYKSGNRWTVYSATDRRNKKYLGSFTCFGLALKERLKYGKENLL